ncbi:hypothetical protein ES705_47479 [subsurface metagenome]
MKRFLVILMVVAMASFLFVGCLPTTNHAPVFTSTPVKTATVGTMYTYTPTATDADGDTVTFTVAGPAGMAISGGVISWTPAAEGTEDVIVTATDGKDPVTQPFTITVEAASVPELTLVGIKVDPEEMDLFKGEFVDIAEKISVTATYEIRGYDVDVDLKDCFFLTNNSKVATVKKVEGEDESTTVTVTAVGVGIADILVEYEGKFATLEVTVTYTPMELKVDMPVFRESVAEGFSIEVIANDDVGKNSWAYFTLPLLPATNYSIDYWEVNLSGGEGWVDLTPGLFAPGEEVVFGLKPGGGPLEDVTFYFYATFSTAGTYLIPVEVWTVDGDKEKDELLCSKVITAVVILEPPTPPVN